MNRKIRIGLDVGGVLSKYPEVFTALLEACESSDSRVEFHIVSDMHPKETIQKMLSLNHVEMPSDRIHSADFSKYGEACKVVLAKQLKLDMMIDDFGGYVAEGDHARLLMMPNVRLPYYHPEWKTDGSEGDFGRRTIAKSDLL